MAANEPPPQLGLFTDGDGMDAITAATDDRSRLEFLRDSTGALAYQVASPGSVLVVGAGGGLEVLRAREHGVGRIEAVELNPQIAALMRGEFAEYTGGLLAGPGELVVGGVRGMLASHGRRYDLNRSRPQAASPAVSGDSTRTTCTRSTHSSSTCRA